MGFAAGTLSDQAEIDIDVFVFENCLFSFVVSMKRDLHIACFKTNGEFFKIRLFSSYFVLFHIIDQIKVSRVQLWIGHASL